MAGSEAEEIPTEVAFREARGRPVLARVDRTSNEVQSKMAREVLGWTDGRERTQRMALRSKWLPGLGALLRGTGTPMVKILDDTAGDCNILGGGTRASTRRARVRAAKKYLSWLALSAEVVFPSQVSHLTGFLETRHSEPLLQGSLKGPHQCMVFLEDVAGSG